MLLYLFKNKSILCLCHFVYIKHMPAFLHLLHREFSSRNSEGSAKLSQCPSILILPNLKRLVKGLENAPLEKVWRPLGLHPVSRVWDRCVTFSELKSLLSSHCLFSSEHYSSSLSFFSLVWLHQWWEFRLCLSYLKWGTRLFSKYSLWNVPART